MTRTVCVCCIIYYATTVPVLQDNLSIDENMLLTGNEVRRTSPANHPPFWSKGSQWPMPPCIISSVCVLTMHFHLFCDCRYCRPVTATCVLNWQRRLYNNATNAFSFVGVGIHPLACLTTSSALVCCQHCGLIGPSPALPYPSPFVSFVLVTIGFPRPIVMCRV